MLRSIWTRGGLAWGRVGHKGHHSTHFVATGTVFSKPNCAGGSPGDSVLEPELGTLRQEVKGEWLLLMCHFLDALQTCIYIMILVWKRPDDFMYFLIVFIFDVSLAGGASHIATAAWLWCTKWGHMRCQTAWPDRGAKGDFIMISWNQRSDRLSKSNWKVWKVVFSCWKCSFVASRTGQSGDPTIDASAFVSKITGILVDIDWNVMWDW